MEEKPYCFFFVFLFFLPNSHIHSIFYNKGYCKKNNNFYIMLNLTLESLSFPLSFFLVSLFSAFFKLSLRAWISRSVYNNNIMQTCKPKLNQYYIYNVLPGYSLTIYVLVVKYSQICLKGHLYITNHCL